MATPTDPVDIAVEVLREGGLVALPTETVYGLAADADNELAVRRIFAVKGRPQSHPLIVHLPDASALGAWAAEVPDAAKKLVAAFWPGPLTLVLKKHPRVLDVVTGGQDTVALRVPSHPLAQKVLRAFGGGVAAPSANRFGRVSPTTAEHVRADLGDDVDYVLDGGPAQIGLESTIVDLSRGAPALLRPGGLAVEEIERVLGVPVPPRASTEVRAPGMLASHYAPRAGVWLAEAYDVHQRLGALMGTGQKIAVIAPRGTQVPAGVALLEVPTDAAGFARTLYRTLREVDEQGFDVCVAVLPPSEGLGLAVRDRLRRAAAPRDFQA
ncbi:MAG: threonylcarbamoyl-AMP synthase [Myxococcaceae bacterium]|nr:threonylcarbamoyl-AMP synthase [Myxococcaceae bacterium]